MDALESMQFPSPDAASEVGLFHKELVGKTMIYDLYKAVEEGDVDNFVEVLKQKCMESKVHVSDIFDKVTLAGDSLLHVAVDLGKEQIAEVIAKHFPKFLIRKNIRGDTPLHVAVRSKNFTSSIVKFIISYYATEKSKDDEMRDKEITRETNECGDTPLHEAVYSDNVDAVEEIFGADMAAVYCLNKSKKSPLYFAVESGNVQILNLLLKFPFPADRSLSQCRGSSPLHAAILHRNHDMIIEIIAERPEIVYLRDEDENSPLYYAADIGYVAEFNILLQNSVLKFDQALERNKKNRLPIHLARKRGFVEIVKAFFEHQWPINSAVLLDQKGQNILHIAAKNGRTKVVKYLLGNYKFDQYINQRDNDGNTPLHLASKNLFPRVLHFITKDNRTNVKLKNKEGFTATDINVISTPVLSSPEMRERKIFSDMVLEQAGVPVRVNQMLHSQSQPQSRKVNKGENSEALLIVATLMVTVTFAAGFTVPGGVCSSDDPNPKIRGTAVLGHKPLFWVFTISNSIAMFASALASGLLSVPMFFPTELMLDVAVKFLSYAFIAAPLAFISAVLLVVANNHSLTLATISIGSILFFFYYVYLVFLQPASPLGYLSIMRSLRKVHSILNRYRHFLFVSLATHFPELKEEYLYPDFLFVGIDYDDKPKVLARSQQANKDKNNGLEEHVQQPK